jgi:hypothetical protein
MNDYPDSVDDAEGAVATLLAQIGDTARSSPPRFTAAEIKALAGDHRSLHRQQLDRYRRPALAWLAVLAVLAVVLVLGLHLTGSSKPVIVSPVSRSSGAHSHKKSLSTIPSTSTTVGRKASGVPHSKTVPTTLRSTPTTFPGPLPVLVAPGYTGRYPGAIYLSGDAGNIVKELKWSSWTPTEAVGYGTSNKQGCVPDCASGTETPEATVITLSDPKDGHFTLLVEQRGGDVETFIYPPSASLHHYWAQEAYSSLQGYPPEVNS